MCHFSFIKFGNNQFFGVLLNKARESNIYGLYYSPVESTMQQQFINMQYYHIENKPLNTQNNPIKGLFFENPTAIYHGLYYAPIGSHSQEQSIGIQYGYFFPS